MQNFEIFCPSDPAMVRIWVKLKLVKFYWYFSRYNFEKLIRTLRNDSGFRIPWKIPKWVITKTLLNVKVIFSLPTL